MRAGLTILLIASSMTLSGLAQAESPPEPTFYRQFTLKTRPQANFQVPMPSGGNLSFSYDLKFGVSKFVEPIVSDFSMEPTQESFFRNFWDKVYLVDGSYIQVGGEQVPLTCIFVSGQDNRFSKKDTPLIPDYVLKIYLVANDFTCTGPINPGWPANGGKKETWDTYVYYEVRDPTIMLPTEIHLRYRWSEFPAILVDQGGGQ